MLSEETIKNLVTQLRETNASITGYEEFIYRGRSMLPLLKEEDRVLVKRITAAELLFGDIIVYKSAGHFIIHRFIYRKQGRDYIVAKGDNSFKADIPFVSKDVLGKIVEIKRSNKRLGLDNNRRRLVNYFTGLFSLSEAVIFEKISIIKIRLFGKLKIENKLKQEIIGIIRNMKLILLKILFLAL